jgi:hypothetical protein
MSSREGGGEAADVEQLQKRQRQQEQAHEALHEMRAARPMASRADHEAAGQRRSRDHQDGLILCDEFKQSRTGGRGVYCCTMFCRRGDRRLGSGLRAFLATGLDLGCGVVTIQRRGIERHRINLHSSFRGSRGRRADQWQMLYRVDLCE